MAKGNINDNFREEAEPTVLLLSQTLTGISAAANGTTVDASQCSQILFHILVSTVTAGNVQFAIDFQLSDGITWNTVATGSARAAPVGMVSGIGPGLSGLGSNDTTDILIPVIPPNKIRLRWGVTVGPITFTYDVWGASI